MPEHALSVGIVKNPKGLLSLGRFRGGPAPTGGFWIEIVGNGEIRRGEMSPRETIQVALAMLASQGIVLEIDPNQFKHLHG